MAKEQEQGTQTKQEAPPPPPPPADPPQSPKVTVVLGKEEKQKDGMITKEIR